MKCAVPKFNSTANRHVGFRRYLVPALLLLPVIDTKS